MSVTVRAVIDRVEDEVAVLEVAGTWVHWPRAVLPEGAGEGSTLEVVLGVVPGDPTEVRARQGRLTGPEGDRIDL